MRLDSSIFLYPLVLTGDQLVGNICCTDNTLQWGCCNCRKTQFKLILVSKSCLKLKRCKKLLFHAIWWLLQRNQDERFLPITGRLNRLQGTPGSTQLQTLILLRLIRFLQHTLIFRNPDIQVQNQKILTARLIYRYRCCLNRSSAVVLGTECKNIVYGSIDDSSKNIQ